MFTDSMMMSALPSACQGLQFSRRMVLLLQSLVVAVYFMVLCLANRIICCLVHKSGRTKG